MSDIVFRDLSGIDEFLAAEALQRAVWGEGDTPDPADLMMVIQSEGGLVGGAFLSGELMGYVFGFPTGFAGIQHSHRLAVHADMRGRGLGIALKLYQRRWCLSRGIRHVRWTFDPLLATNAHLNIGRLGARSNTYKTDYYGAMGGINAGLPSDRLLVDWFVDEPGPTALAEGRDPPERPGETLRIAIPAGGEALKRRLDLRDRLCAAFERGFVATGFDAAAKAYILTRTVEN